MRREYLGLRQLFPEAHFGQVFFPMFGISLPSRMFSSQSLMDGEALISSQDLGGMTEVKMLSELKHLEDWGL